MTIVIIIFAVVAIITLFACCKISGECSRLEEQADPCVNCVRWSECNGVDKDCPWRI